MKITKLSLIAAAIAALGTSVALADSPQLQNRLALQRCQDAGRNDRQATVAVYAGRGVGQRQGAMDARADAQLEPHTTPHGQQIYIYAPAR